ncbi:plasma membrane fusion protein prm1, partial [Coemansia sp. IMI 209127]
MAIDYILLAATARSAAASAVATTNQGCSSIQKVVIAVDNAPRSAAIAAVTMVQNAAQSLIDKTGQILNQVIDMLETLIVMILKLYVGTYICFAELIIQTALSAITEASEELTKVLNVAINSVANSLENTAATVASSLQSAANSVTNFFTGKSGSNTVDFHIDDIKQTLNVTIPTDWINSISDLQSEIPTEDQIFGNVTALLDIPFNFIRNALTGAFATIHVDFINEIDFGQAANETLCVTDPLGGEIITALGEAAAFIMWVAGLAILGFALFTWIGRVLLIIRSYGTFQRRLIDFRKELTTYTPLRTKKEVINTPASRQELDYFVLPGRPWLQRLTNFINKRVGHPEKAAAWRWFADYMMFAPALACLLAGVVGLVTILVQIKLIEDLRTEYTPKIAYRLSDFEYRVIDQTIINGVRNDSIDLANSINSKINATQDALNKDLFGP